MALPIPGYEVIPTVGNRPKMSASPFVNKAIARGQLLQTGLTDAANAITDFYDKIQTSKGIQLAADLSLDMHKQKQDYLASLVNKQNQPETWQQGFTDQVAEQLKDQLSSRPGWAWLTPAQQQQLVNNVRAWQTDTEGELTMNANRRQFQLTADKVTQEMTVQASSLDDKPGEKPNLEQALDKNDWLLQNQYIDPARHDQNKIALTDAWANSAIDARIGPAVKATAVYDTIEQMKAGTIPGWKSLNPKQQEAALRRADESLNEKQRTNLNDVKTKMVNDPSYKPTQEELAGLVDRHLIAAKDAESILKGVEAQDQKALNQAAEMSQVVYSNRIFDHDWKGDPDPQKTAHDFESEISWMPGRYQMSLTHQIDDQLKQRRVADKKGVKTLEKPIKDRVLAALDRDREGLGRFNPFTSEGSPENDKVSAMIQTQHHPFTVELNETQVPVGGHAHLAAALKAMSDEDFAAKYGKGVTRAQVIAAEEYHYSVAKSTLRDWLDNEKNWLPADTFEERADAERMRLVKPYWELATANSLAPTAPTPSDTETDALLKKYGGQ